MEPSYKYFVALFALALSCASCSDNRESASGEPTTSTANTTNFEELKVQGSTTKDADEISAQTLSSSPSPHAGPANAAMRRNRPALLPTERKLLINNAVSISAVDSALRSKQFDKIVESLANDSAKDPEAQDVTNAYKHEIERSLEQGGRLENFSCGLSLCIGSIRTRGGNSAYDRWSDHFFNKPALPNYSFVDHIVTLSADERENRFVFSIDPGTNAVTAPIPRLR